MRSPTNAHNEEMPWNFDVPEPEYPIEQQTQLEEAYKKSKSKQSTRLRKIASENYWAPRRKHLLEAVATRQFGYPR